MKKRFLLFIGFVVIAVTAFLVGRITNSCPDYERIAREVESICLADTEGKEIDWGNPAPKQITLSQVLQVIRIPP